MLTPLKCLTEWLRVVGVRVAAAREVVREVMEGLRNDGDRRIFATSAIAIDLGLEARVLDLVLFGCLRN
ncbi:hypothetical protein Hanom_Chr00s000001g01595561 [Helianthus anomalus]